MSGARDQTVALQSSIAADREAKWREIYKEHFSMVYRLLLRMGITRTDAEDLAQRVFLVAHRHMATQEIGNVGGWLRGITVRVASEHRRWHKVRRLKAWLFGGDDADDHPSRANPEEDAQHGQLQAAIREVLAQMSPKIREVLVLTDVEGCSAAEVSEALHIPANTVRSRQRLGREKFRELWRALEQRKRNS